jgi:hypothetical protein
MNVLHLKVPVSQVSTHLDEYGKITDNEIIKMIDMQIELFMEF